MEGGSGEASQEGGSAPRDPVKTNVLAKWFCAVADAYGRGEALWAYREQGGSTAVFFWTRLREHYSEADADDLFVQWCREQGVTLKREKRNPPVQ